MQKIINNRTLTAKKMLELPTPIILCIERVDFDTAITEEKYKTIRLNLPLAKALSGKTDKGFALGITSTVISLLPRGEAVYLHDFEMLFDPRYKLDVLKLFCEISRHCRLIAKWCGYFNGDSLYYGEPGYDDYAIYNISNYNIACVV